MEVILSDRFKSLNPLSIDEYSAVSVFKMIRDLNKFNEHNENKQNEKPKKRMTKVLDS